MATLEQIEDALRDSARAGDTEAQQKLSDAMRAHPTFQQNASEKLQSGAYKLADDMTHLDKDSQRKNMSKLVARSMGLNDDEVDVTQGMGTYGRFKLSFQPTEQDKVKHLEDTYGRENIRAIDIGGKTKLLYRDENETGGQFRAVDEEGVSLADFFGDTAGAALPIAGAVGAAVATGGASIPLMAGAAALGGFGASAAQDIAVRAGSDEDIQLGEIAKRRGIESAIGIPIDLATAGVGRIFARGLAGGGAKKLVSEVDTAIKRVDSQLDAMGIGKLPDVEALKTGAGSRQASEIAAARPNSKLAKELQSVRDTMGEYRNLVQGSGRFGATADEFNTISSKIANQYKSLVDEVSTIDKGLAKELSEQASRKMRSLQAPTVSEAEVGSRIQQILKGSEGKAGEINDANWRALDEAATASGAKVPAWKLARAINSAADEMEPLKNQALRGLADEIKQMRGRGLTFTEVRDYLKRIDDAVPQSTEAGFKTAQQVAIAARKSVEGLRSDVAKRAGIEKQFDDTINYYLNDYLNFKRQAVGSALKESTGAMAPPEVAARSVLSNASGVKSALRAARQGGAQEEAALRGNLQDLYLNRIGLTGEIDPKAMKLDFNDDIVRELWGDSKVKAFKNLQQRLEQIKGIKVADLTEQDVKSYLTALTGDEKNRIISQIAKRSQNLDKVSRQKNAILLKKLRPKYDKQTRTWLEPEITGTDLATFSKDFIRGDVSQVRAAMELLEAQGDEVGMQAFRQSFIGNLFDSFKSGAQLDSFGNPLWNPKAFAQATKKGSPLYKKMEAVLGDSMDDILSANRVLLEASETTGKQVQDIFQPRYSLTSGGVQLYGVGNLIGGLRGRALAWAYGSKNGARLMRFLTNPGTEAETQKKLQKLLPALMTSSGGLKAAAIQGQFDPEFTEAIQPLYDQPQGE